MSITRRLAGIAFVTTTVIAVILFGLWLGLPAALRWGIETYAAGEIGRAIKVGEIRFNPLKLKADIQALSIAGLPSETVPLLSVDSILIDVSLASLPQRAPIIESLHAQGVRANVSRLAENRFNFSDIVDLIRSKPADPEPPRYALYNVEIDDAAISLDDLVTRSRHTLDAIKLGVPFISSLPDDVKIKVKPSFSAVLDGKPIALSAETQPFGNSLDTGVTFKLKGLDLPQYLSYVPADLNFALPSGTLDADLRFAFRRAVAATKTAPATTSKLSLSGSLGIGDLVFVPKNGDPLIAWRRLEAALDDVNLLDRIARVQSASIEGLQANIVRLADGSFAGQAALLQPIEPKAAAKPSAEVNAPGKAFVFELASLKIPDAQVDFKDQGVGFKRRFASVNLELTGLSNHPGSMAKLALSLATDDKTNLTADGEVGIAPLKAELKTNVTNLLLASAQPYLKRFTNARASGNINFAARVSAEMVDAKPEVRIEDVNIDAKRLQLRDDSLFNGMLKLASLKVNDGAFDLQRNSLKIGDVQARAWQLRASGNETAAFDFASLVVANTTVELGARSAKVGRVRLNGLRLNATRQTDGALDWTRLAGMSQGAAAAAKDSASRAQKNAWKFALGDVQVNDGRIRGRDETTQPATQVAIDDLRLSLRGISNTGKERTTVTLHAGVGGGSVDAKGWVRAVPLASNLELDVQNVDVGTLRGYLHEYSGATLASASLWTKGQFQFDTPADPNSSPQLAFDGSARVTNMNVLDTAGENLLRWQSLDLNGLKAAKRGPAPEINLAKIVLSDFFARLILDREGKLNLGKVVKTTGTDGEPAGTERAQSQSMPPVNPVARSGTSLAVASASSEPKPMIRIGGIEFVRGNVNYTDLFVRPNYSAILTQLDGTISAIASDVEKPAEVSVRGRVDNDAPVLLTGTINPLAPKFFLDIAASANGVELPRLTPYSVKYAGYPITKGKLSLDVRYHLENGELKAENHVFLDQLTFGDRVENTTATKLPVLLAVALLKNQDGEIDINLPISGSLSDPQFSIGGIIVRVIVNLLTKVITAPFSLLASAFGGGPELSYLEFPPGIAQPKADQAKKLETIAKAMNARPALRLEILGRVDPVIDTEPLRQAKLDNQLRNAKVRAIVRKGETVDAATVTVTPEERPALIAAVYDDTKIPGKPRNLIGMAKKIPIADMEKLLLTTITVDEQDLRSLALERSAFVRRRLEDPGKVARERTFIIAPKMDADGIKDKGATTRVDFSLK